MACTGICSCLFTQRVSFTYQLVYFNPFSFVPPSKTELTSTETHFWQALLSCLGRAPPSMLPASAMELELAILPTNSNGTCRSSIATRYQDSTAMYPSTRISKARPSLEKLWRRSRFPCYGNLTNMLASFPTERLCIFEISDHFGYYLNTRPHSWFISLLNVLVSRF